MSRENQIDELLKEVMSVDDGWGYRADAVHRLSRYFPNHKIFESLLHLCKKPDSDALEQEMPFVAGCAIAEMIELWTSGTNEQFELNPHIFEGVYPEALSTILNRLGDENLKRTCNYALENDACSDLILLYCWQICHCKALSDRSENWISLAASLFYRLKHNPERFLSIADHTDIFENEGLSSFLNSMVCSDKLSRMIRPYAPFLDYSLHLEEPYENLLKDLTRPELQNELLRVFYTRSPYSAESYFVNLNVAVDGIRSLLFQSIQEGSIIVIKFLLGFGIDIHDKFSNGLTPFLFACALGKLPIAKCFADKEVDICAVTESHENALTLAAQGHSLEMIQWLCEKGVDLFFQNAWKMNALQIVISVPLSPEQKDKNEIEICAIVEYLINKGLQVNEGIPTPLQLACGNGLLLVVKALLRHHANIQPSDQIDQTALYLAIKSRNEELCQVLVEEIVQISPKDINEYLLAAASGCLPGIVNFLLEIGGDIKSTNEHGNTPLHFAAMSNAPDLVLLLVEKGADITARNLEGQTALDIALTKGNLPLIQYLKELAAHP